MPNVFIDCPTHGIQVTPDMVQTTGTNWSFGFPENDAILGFPCPVAYCDQIAMVVRGAYYQDTFGSWKPDLSPTPDQAKRLRKALQRAQKDMKFKRATPEQVAARLVTEIGATVPDVVPFFEQALKALNSPTSHSLSGWLGAVAIPLLIWYLSANHGVSADDVQRVVEQLLRDFQSSLPPTGP